MKRGIEGNKLRVFQVKKVRVFQGMTEILEIKPKVLSNDLGLVESQINTS